MTQLPAGSRVRPDLEAYLNQLASSARKRAGRKPLKASNKLNGAARGQAADMLLGNYVGHHSRSGYRFSARFAAYAGKDFQGRHGENAARDRHRGAVNKAKAKRLFNQWMNSGGHRRNLLNRSYAYVSTGAIQKGNHLYAVQIFWEPGQKKPSVNMLVIN
ncbi:MAG: CAP domain-containing protein [Hyphomicrobiales bacterium]